MAAVALQPRDNAESGSPAYTVARPWPGVTTRQEPRSSRVARAHQGWGPGRQTVGTDPKAWPSWAHLPHAGGRPGDPLRPLGSRRGSQPPGPAWGGLWEVTVVVHRRPIPPGTQAGGAPLERARGSGSALGGPSAGRALRPRRRGSWSLGRAQRRGCDLRGAGLAGDAQETALGLGPWLTAPVVLCGVQEPSGGFLRIQTQGWQPECSPPPCRWSPFLAYKEVGAEARALGSFCLLNPQAL